MKQIVLVSIFLMNTTKLSIVTRVLFTSLFVCLVACAVICQNFSYTQYTTVDGLPTNYVYGAIEDEHGYIWVYTERGIAKFDGYSFKSYGIKDGLSDEDIFLMVRDSFNTLWLVGYLDNPTFLDNDHIRTVNLEGRKFSLKECESNLLLFSDGDSKILFHKDSIVQSRTFSSNYLKYGSGDNRSVEVNLNTNHSFSLSLSSKTLTEFNGEDMAEHPFDISNVNVVSSPGFFVMEHSVLYFPFEDQICFYDTHLKKQKNIFWRELGVKNPLHVNGFQKGEDYYICTSNFVLQLDSTLNVVKKYQFHNITDRYTLMRFYVDDSGNFWIGTKEGGLFLITHSERNSKSIESPNPNDIVFENLIQMNNRIYVLTDRSGLYEVVDDKLIELIYPESKNGNDFIGLYGDYILCTGDKSFVYDIKQRQMGVCSDSNIDCLYNITSEIGYSKFVMSTINYDSIFFSHYNALSLLKLQGNEEQLVGAIRVSAMCTDRVKGKYYFASKNEIFQFIDGELIVVCSLKDNISSITALGDGFLWIGTYSSGLYKYNLELQNFELNVDLDRVKKIVLDQSVYYIASDQGISVGCSEFNGFSIKYVYNAKDGLTPGFINDMLIVEDDIYCATSSGLYRIDKQVHIIPAVDSVFYVVSLSVRDSVFSLDHSIDLERTQNDVEIKYHFNQYESKGQIKYYYKLEPIDANWRTTSDRSVSYNDLGPDTYVFHLKAKDAFGYEHECSQPLSFTVLPRLTETIWFRLLCVLTIIGLVVYVFVRNDTLHKSKVEKEKEQNRKLANLKLESLRSQMNPHFIFNSLGSILYYIQTNKVDEADDYLTKFARLMRRYLDSSSENLVLLSEEIALIKDYVYLEKMRFDFSFVDNVTIDDNLNPQTIYLPGMIIQPFVENAILHGLQARKDGKAALNIKFENIDKYYFSCAVEDNGVGMGNSTSVSSHKSRAMANIQNRLKVLKAAGVSTVEISTKVLDQNSNFPGTRVFVKLLKQHIDD